MGFGNGQGFVDVVMRTIDVLENASLEAAGFGIVFFLRYVVMGLVQEVAGLVQVSAPGQVRVDRFMLVDVFAIVDRGFLDFIDGVVDFFDGLTLFNVNRAAVRTMLEMGPRVPQIGESVELHADDDPARGYSGRSAGEEKQEPQPPGQNGTESSCELSPHVELVLLIMLGKQNYSIYKRVKHGEGKIVAGVGRVVAEKLRRKWGGR